MKIVGYVRLSQDETGKHTTSIDNQIRYIREYCERNNYELAKIYNEGLVSGGGQKERKQFNQMITDAENKLFDAIIVKDDSRFSRSPREIDTICHSFKALGVSIFTCSGDDMTKDIMLTLIKASVNMQVIEKGRDSQRRMMKDKAEDRLPFGRPPMGYEVFHKKVEAGVEKTWRVVPEESRKVRECFRLYLEKYKPEEIGGIIGCTEMTVYNILKRKVYIGLFNYTKKTPIILQDGKGEVVEEVGEYSLKIPKIVDEEVFYQVQERLEGNRIVHPSQYRRKNRRVLPNVS